MGTCLLGLTVADFFIWRFHSLAEGRAFLTRTNANLGPPHFSHVKREQRSKHNAYDYLSPFARVSRMSLFVVNYIPRSIFSNRCNHDIMHLHPQNTWH